MTSKEACQLCANLVGNKLHTAREMMFGFRDQFTYLECGNCGCLQLITLPQDMARYCPKNYYSYQHHGKLMTAIRHRWSAFAFGKPSLIGWALAYFYFPNNAMTSVRRLNLPCNANVLDVGCGSGHLLLDLKHLGYQNVTGADPFIQQTISYGGGPTIFKKELKDLDGKFDLVMLHHCFEHMAKPTETLEAIAGLLTPGGRVIIRIPVASSYGWRHYGVNWVHLDAPRHLFLHTYQSIKLIAEKAGLTVVDTIQEADDGTFWASEAYAKDISMYDPRFPTSTALRKILTWRKTMEYRARARELNQRREADSVCFYLTRKATTR